MYLKLSTMSFLKEPIAIASRHVPTGSSPHRVRTSTKIRKVSAALDAATDQSKGIRDADGSIEIEGPFLEPVKLKTTISTSMTLKGALEP